MTNSSETTPEWREHEERVLERAAELFDERGGPSFALEELRASVGDEVPDAFFEDHFPEMSAVWRGLALVRGLEVPPLDDLRARVTNMDMRAVGAFLHARTIELTYAQAADGTAMAPVVDDLFWVVLAPEIVPAEHLVHAVTDFALPALAEEGIPTELIAAIARVGDWRAVFYTAVPEPRQWMRSLEPLGGLDYFVHLQYDAGDPAHSSFARFKHGSLGRVWGSEEVAPHDVVLLSEYPDAFTHADTGPVEALLEAETGLSVEQLQGAMADSEPVMLVHQGHVVLERPR
jgi:hypothetical protein